jgi:hypothetical protein
MHVDGSLKDGLFLHGVQFRFSCYYPFSIQFLSHLTLLEEGLRDKQSSKVLTTNMSDLVVSRFSAHPGRPQSDGILGYIETPLVCQVFRSSESNNLALCVMTEMKLKDLCLHQVKDGGLKYRI